MSDDPFAMFGGDEDGEDNEAGVDVNQQGESSSIDERTKQSSAALVDNRAPENGFNLYHSGTEQAMLQFVKNGMSHSVAEEGADDNDQLSAVIRLVDEFCFQRHWMMHIGPEKGRLLDEFLLERVQQHRENPGTRNQPFIVLEIGTYCGYSSTRMARVLRQHASLTDEDFRIITIDVDPLHVRIARQLHELAGIGGTSNVSSSSFNNQPITYMQLDPLLASNVLGERVQEALANISASDNKAKETPSDTTKSSNLLPHFVFLDHDKDLYKQDMQILEKAGIIQKDCAVAADNVYFFGLHDYRSFMQQQANDGIVSTRLVKGLVEYVVEKNNDETWQDGIELSVYLKDPK